MKPTANTEKQSSKRPPQNENSEAAEALQLVLADTFVLYMKTYAVHWNYQGPKFFSVHKMTEEQYQQLAEAIDEIAERLRAIGKVAPISLETILANSDLKEFQKSYADGDKAIMDLAAGHTLLSQRAHEAAEACEEAEDLYSNDMMVARIGAHDKAAWMLRSFMQHGDSKAQSTLS